MPDIEVSTHGNIVVLHPATARGEMWIMNNTQMMIINGVATMEMRYLAPLLDAMNDDGLEVLPL